jgi:hypothetical protein
MVVVDVGVVVVVVVARPDALTVRELVDGRAATTRARTTRAETDTAADATTRRRCRRWCT